MWIRFPWNRNWLISFSFFLLVVSSQTASAENLACEKPYKVAKGDSLSVIAQKAYGSAGKYSMIYYANLDILTKGPSSLEVNQELRIPCLYDATAATSSTEKTPDPATASSSSTEATTTTTTTTTAPTETPAVSPPAKVELQLLTAGDYQPFTDQSLPNGGLITELVEAALKNQNVTYKLTWINDWSAHLDPLLKDKKYDMGFPWLNPGCPNVEHFRCQFLFSTPIFQMLEVLFTRNDQPLKFEKDDDMIGHTLCRPSGYFTHDLERPGREWLKKNLVKLEQPQSVKECFEMLMAGKVDAVAMNDFTGRETVAKMGLQDKVSPLPKELSVEGLHVLIHKTHPRATILLNYVNKGLKAIQDSGEYDAIMDKHLTNHWKTVESLQKQ
ncbi:MAG TPA: transporter substrate-binding domain-containing protein [Thiolinea sp.]|nr:transporter substrate-binding domain-containing protein [Thiolinea sp.]